MNKIFLFIILILSITSCDISKSLIEINRKHVKVYDYKMGNKEIRFIPMHHLGKQRFYDEVAEIITENKKQGYIVYYELVSTDFTDDSLFRDTIRRKARKLIGFSGSYKENVEGTFLDKYIQQPSYEDLGTDENDVRADVDFLQLINQWEKVNGMIILDSLDFNTPFGEDYNNKLDYSQRQYRSIFVGYRNDLLIKRIKEDPDNKILVVYGEGHRKDFQKKIK